MRGVESHGMLCSERELGLSEEHEGLMELPLDAPVGDDIIEYLKLDDSIVDVDLTPNRSDCLSMIGSFNNFIFKPRGSFFQNTHRPFGCC